jgi:hypothetical protein
VDLGGIDPLLLAIGIALALAALFFLVLRQSVMIGFLCIVGVVVVAVIAAYPDFSFSAR